MCICSPCGLFGGSSEEETLRIKEIIPPNTRPSSYYGSRGATPPQKVAREAVGKGGIRRRMRSTYLEMLEVLYATLRVL